ncbi:sugar phosphate nucleotidyltransferase [Desmospora profundinema]|uniref:NDP-sugar pyrophosphorylase family protein n=1 Tax=Desmospora profundinema TaxID=1571184 RepID=A0ABU1IJJ4_9BACL|nr:sugar phosphate nucleotidyltransferase [Desmospora profundinema]MDR6224334.1 NDP-sugar pyrophosphorylase family protein [Desmospora profundinema]
MDAVIVTGGKGTRMAPYTQVLPKGLLPVGGQPTLEIIVKQLKYHGFRHITMLCGYLAPLIQTYFGDGSRWGVSIRYRVEKSPLGTVGPLKGMTCLTQPFLMMNCDVLTTLHMKDFHDFHRTGDSLLTIATQTKKVPVNLGVLETHEDLVTQFLEKPMYPALVNMGIYMMDPKIIDYIPDQTFFDMPDLIQVLLNAHKKVRHYHNDAFWMDIGRPGDFEEANQLYATIASQLLPVDSSNSVEMSQTCSKQPLKEGGT